MKGKYPAPEVLVFAIVTALAAIASAVLDKVLNQNRRPPTSGG